MTRSMTISSSSSSSPTPKNDKKMDKNLVKPSMTTSLHLPDIIPNSSSTESNQITTRLPAADERTFRLFQLFLSLENYLF